MSDVIRLLSDHLANQIAAGEVIQRPASAVKELLENAVDAGATDIQLILKDAGKELIQVVDNGSGMTPTDARMAFERHATSKIRDINDLFRIQTMGFRGEALASMAAVAQVELKTRREADEVGTRLVIEATDVKLQEPCATPAGTSLSIKNLFYNVPARRHFLKSNTTELRHTVDEFTRVAMAYPDIAFRLFHNGTVQFRLDAGSSKARIVGLLGNSFERNLVPVEEETDFLNIKGFIGKPEAATKTRGNQFFFVNNRFVRSPYLHHAVTGAYEGLIEKDAFPFYVLFLEIDPARVDVNVHPTKQEVKFEDDKLMYAYLNAAVKHALARYNIAPSLDFTLNQGITQLPSVNLPVTDQGVEQAQKSYLAHAFADRNQAHVIEQKDSLQKWKEMYAGARERALSAPIAMPLPESVVTIQSSPLGPLPDNKPADGTHHVLLVQGSMLMTTVKSGVMLIHIRRAQERIWYERLLQEYNTGQTPSQQVLFPVTVELPPHDAILLNEVLPDLARIGFDISSFGQHTFVVQGVPTELPAGEERNVIDEVVDQLKHEASDALTQRTDRLLMNMARRLSRNKHLVQQREGQQILIDELFACSQPEYTPDGKRVFRLISRDELDAML